MSYFCEKWLPAFRKHTGNITLCWVEVITDFFFEGYYSDKFQIVYAFIENKLFFKSFRQKTMTEKALVIFLDCLYLTIDRPFALVSGSLFPYGGDNFYGKLQKYGSSAVLLPPYSPKLSEQDLDNAIAESIEREKAPDPKKLLDDMLKRKKMTPKAKKLGIDGRYAFRGTDGLDDDYGDLEDEDLLEPRDDDTEPKAKKKQLSPEEKAIKRYLLQARKERFAYVMAHPDSTYEERRVAWAEINKKYSALLDGVINSSEPVDPIKEAMNATMGEIYALHSSGHGKPTEEIKKRIAELNNEFAALLNTYMERHKRSGFITADEDVEYASLFSRDGKLAYGFGVSPEDIFYRKVQFEQEELEKRGANANNYEVLIAEIRKDYEKAFKASFDPSRYSDGEIKELERLLGFMLRSPKSIYKENNRKRRVMLREFHLSVSEQRSKKTKWKVKSPSSSKNAKNDAPDTIPDGEAESIEAYHDKGGFIVPQLK